MKILFLDIDGVVNSVTTAQRHRGMIGIDPYMALLVGRIIEATDASIVLSSSWRHDPGAREEVTKQVMPFIDVTPNFKGETSRGTEIKAWLDLHPEVTKYAILDDNEDMRTEQMPNFFKTSWSTGLTQEIADAIIAHLSTDK